MGRLRFLAAFAALEASKIGVVFLTHPHSDHTIGDCHLRQGSRDLLKRGFPTR